MKNVATNFSDLKSKVDELDADKLIPVPVDLNTVSDVLKKTYIMLRSKILKIKQYCY